MKVSTLIKLVVWFVIFIALLNIGLEMITAPNTMENIVGVGLLVAVVVISINTKCLTSIGFYDRRKSKER